MPDYVRTAGAATALAAALLLSGCSSDSGSEAKANHSARAVERGGNAPASGRADGVWTTRSDGDGPILLSISRNQVALVGKRTCTGRLTGVSGSTGLELQCPGDDNDRVTGAASPSVDGKTLQVSWGSGIRETYTRVADDKLPEDLPKDLRAPSR